MTEPEAGTRGGSATSSAPRRLSPAPIESARVDGLAVTRRRRTDIDPGRPTIVLVHGAMDRSASFGRVMRRLPEFDVVTYDRRGYAGSDRWGYADPDRFTSDAAGPDDISGSCPDGGRAGGRWSADSDVLQAHARDLQAVIDWSGASHSVVIGHSLGGTIAMAAAVLPEAAIPEATLSEATLSEAALPEATVTGASVSETGMAGADRSKFPGPIVGLGVFESPAPWLDGSFSAVGKGAISVADTDGDEAAAEFFYRSMIGEATFARLRDKDRQARRSEGPAFVAELRALRNPSFAFDLTAVRVPTIVGTGALSSDAMRRSAKLLGEALPDAWGIEIAGAGHGAHLTHPDEFAAYVRGCVARAEVALESVVGVEDE